MVLINTISRDVTATSIPGSTSPDGSATSAAVRPVAYPVPAGAYYHDYDDLRGAKLGSVPLPTPPFPPGTVRALFDNDTDAVGYGAELGGNWNVPRYWTVSGWYTLMKLDVDADPANADVIDEGQEDDTPTNQVHFRSRLNLPWDLEFDTHLFYVGEVSHQQAGEYTRLDLRRGWRPIESVELSVDVHVDVFKGRLELHLAGGDFDFDLVETFEDLLAVGWGDDALLNQHFQMRSGASDVLAKEMAVKADRGIDLGHDG